MIMLFESQLSPIENDGPPLSASQRATAHDIIAQATTQLESLLRLYYLRHGFGSYDALLLVHLVHIGNASLTRLEQIEQGSQTHDASHATIESLRSTLILCLKGLHDQSKNSYISGVVLGVMKNRLSPENRNLVGRFVTMNDVDQEVIGRSQRITSEYVIPIVNLNEDPQAGRLANMVQKFGWMSPDN
jgi:hypothetical protein